MNNNILHSAIRELAIEYTAGDFTPLLLCKAIATYCVKYLRQHFGHTLVLFQDGRGTVVFREAEEILDFDIDLADHAKAIQNAFEHSAFPLITQFQLDTDHSNEYPLRDILTLCNSQSLNHCLDDCRSLLIGRLTWNDGHTVGIIVFGRKSPETFSEDEQRLVETISDILSNKLIGLCSRYFGPTKINGESFGIGSPFYIGKKSVAVLFADVRNYTTFMSRFENRNEVRAGLLRYFEMASQVIFRNNGMLDKFIGDGLMAMFGVRELGVDQSGLTVGEACRTAVELRKVFDQVNAEFFQTLIEDTSLHLNLSVGIGIEFGDVYLDFFGDSRTWYYSAIGDVVNTASRLESKAGKQDEGQSKPYPAILVGKAAFNKFSHWQGFEGFEPTKVTLELKGKAIPVDAYGLRTSS